mmetsp:Transcript_18954/g.39646  ORF Transcript_18954/g.39646 Transcript_18954/m.39646 type:complete len:309 (-) Transcript_18954:1727-2653(-)
MLPSADFWMAEDTASAATANLVQPQREMVAPFSLRGPARPGKMYDTRTSANSAVIVLRRERNDGVPTWNAAFSMLRSPLSASHQKVGLFVGGRVEESAWTPPVKLASNLKVGLSVTLASTEGGSVTPVGAGVGTSALASVDEDVAAVVSSVAPVVDVADSVEETPVAKTVALVVEESVVVEVVVDEVVESIMMDASVVVALDVVDSVVMGGDAVAAGVDSLTDVVAEAVVVASVVCGGTVVAAGVVVTGVVEVVVVVDDEDVVVVSSPVEEVEDVEVVVEVDDEVAVATESRTTSSSSKLEVNAPREA